MRRASALDRGVLRVGHAAERSTNRSGVEVSRSHPGGRRSQSTEIVRVTRGDDRASPEVGIGDEEGIDRKLRPGPDRSEQLAGSDTGAGLDRVHLDTLPSHAGEHACISEDRLVVPRCRCAVDVTAGRGSARGIAAAGTGGPSGT